MSQDETAIRRVLAGDREAFRAVVERHQGALFGFVANFLPRCEDREDVVQDVLLAAFARLETFDPRRARFTTWLFTIARNRCLNLIKAGRIRTPAPDDRPVEPIDARTPAHDAARAELFRRLDAVLDELPDTQRAVFVLADLQGLPHAEIARIEDVEPGTVKSRLSRAREKLRARLSHRRMESF